MTEQLPPPTPELKGLCDLCGSREAALALIEAHGGTAIYVPHKLQSSVLAETIDEELIGRLQKRYGGDWLKVPSAKPWRIQVYRARGMTIKDIARRLTMTENGVYKSLQLAGLSNSLPGTDGSKLKAAQQLDLLTPLELIPPPPQG